MHSRKTALHLIDSLYRGGAQKVVVEIVRALPEYRHVVCFWADSDDLRSDFESLGATLIRLPFGGFFSFPKTWWKFQIILKQYDPQFIHSHMFIPNMLSRLGKRRGVMCLSTYHGECFELPGWRGALIRLLEKLTIQKSDRLLAVSVHVRAYVTKKLKKALNMEVIHNFGNSVVVRNSQRPWTLPIKMVATSNNQPYKGYLTILTAFAKMKDDSVSLDIYGGGMDSLQAFCVSQGIRNVKFMGSVRDIPSILGDYDVFITASDSGEGFSLSLLEAMNAGLVIMCTDLPQFLEAVGNAGIIFKKSNPDDLVARLRELARSPTQLANYSRAGIERSKLFTREIFVSKTRTAYDLS